MKLRKTILDHHSFMQDITRLKNSDVYQNMTHISIQNHYYGKDINSTFLFQNTSRGVIIT